ncbi:TetR/AcrR family transcriptional regulator [Cryptosporangium aurantiacum]|uniref:Transcriptional regulator, TetR family n=1 Tax=Cryptosporangium aurantiacum TaxID=134849 RepID=A0A1M7RC03_9ACTN|nr:TetR/AcrR family transcriptional regulator [Cryptosporangium aurantiacum]SHN43700.1 transcriptional regulator, TetR family [Cryptosporangium aurantiacum]
MATRESVPRSKRRATSPKAQGRRSELLAIAAELFATKGYTQTTVRDIGDAAGILSGSLYHHFDSKEAMLDEILRDFMGSLHAAFAEIVAGGESPRQVLEGLVRCSFGTIHERPHAVALYQNESALLAHLPDFTFVARTSQDITGLWLGVLAAGQESGDFRADLEPGVVYRFIRDSVWGAVGWYKPDGKLAHSTLADQYLTMLYGGLLRA